MDFQVAPYDSSWPQAFEEEAPRIADALGDVARRIEHIGSTSVPGLGPKPIIDIQVSVDRVQPMDPYRGTLEALGYTHVSLPEPGDDVYPYFLRPPQWPPSHHVHVCQWGGLEERRHLAFRDWLREHPEDRQTYEELKNALAELVDQSDPATFFRYTEGKTDFVRAIEVKASGSQP